MVFILRIIQNPDTLRAEGRVLYVRAGSTHSNGSVPSVSIHRQTNDSVLLEMKHMHKAQILENIIVYSLNKLIVGK
jgi:hypothetical protein